MKNQINQSACLAIMDVDNTTTKCQNRLLDLLDEELTMTCSICSVVIDDQVYRCSQCSQPCHSHCSTSDEYETTCKHCVSIDEMDSLVHNNAPVNRRENTDGTIFKDTQRINQYESNACQYRTTCTNKISNEDTTENSVNHSVNLEQTSLKTVQIDTNDENVPNNSVKHKPDMKVKQSKLRQKEQKLGKS